ncbi:HK97 family phage prohead protease [Parvibaculum sp.]|uniref:HK97 family phage prohead protease n=1 Tax=Parvibaculum sp. TaxID=2024848 RepID=UPI00320E0F34
MADFLAPLEFKLAGDRGEIVGYASEFGTKDHGGDTVQAGAFAASLATTKAAGRQIPMLWQHRPDEPIGSWNSAVEDRRGLKVSGRIVLETSRGQEAFALAKAGALNGLSIGYRTIKSRPAGGRGRFLDQLDLVEISLVTFPMLDSARISAVKTQTTITRADVKSHLMHMPGMNGKLARALLANVDWSALNVEDDTDTKSRLADALRRHIENFNKGQKS